MKKIQAFLIAFFVLSVSSTFAFAITAEQLSAFLPDKILKYTKSEAPVLEDLKKGTDTYHRVQKTYKAKDGVLAIIAIINGAGVEDNIASQFAKGKKRKINDLEGVAIAPEKNSMPIASASIKLDNKTMITAVTFNTTDVSEAIKILEELDTKGLLNLISNEN